MNTRDPKLTALLFNEHINNQDIAGLSGLMSDDHTFIDREGAVYPGKETMTRGWIEFFQSFPDYRNTFNWVESRDDLVILIGYATWSQGSRPDHAIWTAIVRENRVAEWRIYEDTDENRVKLGIV